MARLRRTHATIPSGDRVFRPLCSSQATRQVVSTKEDPLSPLQPSPQHHPLLDQPRQVCVGRSVADTVFALVGRDREFAARIGNRVAQDRDLPMVEVWKKTDEVPRLLNLLLTSSETLAVAIKRRSDSTAQFRISIGLGYSMPIQALSLWAWADVCRIPRDK